MSVLYVSLMVFIGAIFIFSAEICVSSGSNSQPAVINPNELYYNTSIPKFVILTFDDVHESQFTYAIRTLDKYDFKATFFVVCDWMNEKDWETIKELHQDGWDIQAHTVRHQNLDELSGDMLEYEIIKGQDCLNSRGINSTVFAYPYGNGWDNSTVVKLVADNYDVGRTSSGYPLAFMNCDYWNMAELEQPLEKIRNQMTIEFINSVREYPGGICKYAVNGWEHVHIEGDYDYSNSSCIGPCEFYNNSQMLDRFIQAVNSQTKFNEDGTIRAIPIVVYHSFAPFTDVSESKNPLELSVNLFDSEMKYLKDNDFNVLTMKDLRYDQDAETLYVENMSQWD